MNAEIAKKFVTLVSKAIGIPSPLESSAKTEKAPFLKQRRLSDPPIPSPEVRRRKAKEGEERKPQTARTVAHRTVTKKPREPFGVSSIPQKIPPQKDKLYLSWLGFEGKDHVKIVKQYGVVSAIVYVTLKDQDQDAIEAATAKGRQLAEQLLDQKVRWGQQVQQIQKEINAVLGLRYCFAFMPSGEMALMVYGTLCTTL